MPGQVGGGDHDAQGIGAVPRGLPLGELGIATHVLVEQQHGQAADPRQCRGPDGSGHRIQVAAVGRAAVGRAAARRAAARRTAARRAAARRTAARGSAARRRPACLPASSGCAAPSHAPRAAADCAGLPDIAKLGRPDDDGWLAPTRGLGLLRQGRGRGAWLERRGQVGEANLVALGEYDRAGEAPAVDERAAGGIQIADRDLPRLTDRDERVPAADVLVGEPDVGGGRVADHQLGGGERQDQASLLGRSGHHEPREVGHRYSFQKSPTMVSTPCGGGVTAWGVTEVRQLWVVTPT